MNSVVELLRTLAFGHLVALLPSPERERLAFRHELDAPRWSFELGLLQAGLGAAMFLLGGLAFMRPAVADQSMTLLENWWSGLSSTHFRALGIINWLAWFLNPLSWPFAYLGMVGLTRCVAFAITREAVAEPLVWLSLRGFQALRSRSDARRREERLGPARPDRLVTGEGGDLVVVTCREKPEWSGMATIDINRRYYRVVGVEERQDGPWRALAYRLREQNSAEAIRRLVRYDPPASTAR